MTNKAKVLLISSLIVLAFLALVYYGFWQRRGVPVAYEEPQGAELEIPLLEEEIDLASGISMELWERLASTQVELMYQVTVLPWPQKLVPTLTVKAFHNKKDIHFYLSWEDQTENRSLDIGKFSDACAIMFALEEEVKPTTIMMGFLSKTNIWQWKANQDREYWENRRSLTKAYADFYYPFEEKELFVVSKEVPKSAANDLTAIRVGTVTPKDTQNVQGRGFWKEGAWHVIFKRSLKEEDSEVDITFAPTRTRYCSFGVWNGEVGDRGGRKSISEWVGLKIR